MKTRAITFLAVLGLIFGVSVAGSSDTAEAADLSQFRPGNIIDDSVFYNSSSMTEEQIAAFINAKGPNCASGKTCLKTWRGPSESKPANPMCSAFQGAASETAASLIYKVSRACGINPQVILVTLQKEQGLITSSAPSDYNFNFALGYNCPDTTGCTANGMGFSTQIYGGAWQLKRYSNPPGTSNYFNWFAPGRTWNVLWHPDAARCGSGPVFIENQATASLYYYTPYQPNAAALRAGYGLGDGCSSYGNRNFYQYFTDWFGSPTEVNPFGNIELVEARPGEFAVIGWAADPNTSDSIPVHVYVGGVGTAISANLDRADVGAAYPKLGSKHGFSAVVPATGSGTVSVCVYAINAGPGANVLLGCHARTAMSGVPAGALDSAVGVEGGIKAEGWALDPDTTGPISVHLYVDAAGTAVTANASRPDIAAQYPAYGAAHGFSATLPAAPGTHNVCAYGINVGAGSNVLLGCKSVIVPGAADLGRPPIGVFESLTIEGNVATAVGWALDPDTTSSIRIHLYAGAVGTEHVADKSRGDVGALYPAYGSNHGFVEKLTLPTGPSTVCAYAINTGAGGHTLLGCKTVTATSLTEKGRAPVGAFESLSVNGATATATGWALDPDTASPIKVHIYVGNSGAEYTADAPRSDLSSSYPEHGPNHGFSQQVTLPVGTSTVCAYGINTGPGGHSLLGCKTVTVPAPGADRGRPPFGNLEGVVPSAGAVTVSGWALDPDTSSPIAIHVYVDAVGMAFTASHPRGDVGAAYGLGDNHGFLETVPAAPGAHTVCVYAINNGAGGHSLVGCRPVVVP